MDHIRSTSDFMDFRVLKHCLFGIWVRSSKAKLPEGQASPGILLGFADCQVRATFRVVGNALFFAELFYFFTLCAPAHRCGKSARPV